MSSFKSKPLNYSKKLSYLFIGLFSLMGTLAPAVITQAEVRGIAKGIRFDFVTFYESPGFRGASFTVESAGEISSLSARQLDFYSGLTGFSSRQRVSWDNVISSIAFNGAFKVTLFSERNFAGTQVSYTTSQRNLAAKNRIVIDNQTSSLKWEPLLEGQGQPRVIFYDRQNFEGNSFFLYPGDTIGKLSTKRRDSRRKDWDDEIRSVRVVGSEVRVILYADKEYDNKRVTIRSDASSLLPIGFSAVASSVRVLSSGINSGRN